MQQAMTWSLFEPQHTGKTRSELWLVQQPVCNMFNTMQNSRNALFLIASELDGNPITES